jgi:hypothetical protein
MLTWRSLSVPLSSKGICTFLSRPTAWCCSPTGAAAAAIARATSPSPLRSTEQVSARCCSTCSLRQRSSNVFDMDLFATRLTAATRWLRSRSDSASCRVGYFGASTGAGAALLAVVDRATHLFEEPGTLAEVAILASDWFTRYLAKEPQNPSVA